MWWQMSRIGVSMFLKVCDIVNCLLCSWLLYAPNSWTGIRHENWAHQNPAFKDGNTYGTKHKVDRGLQQYQREAGFQDGWSQCGCEECKAKVYYVLSLTITCNYLAKSRINDLQWFNGLRTTLDMHARQKFDNMAFDANVMQEQRGLVKLDEMIERLRSIHGSLIEDLNGIIEKRQMAEGNIIQTISDGTSSKQQYPT